MKHFLRDVLGMLLAGLLVAVAVRLLTSDRQRPVGGVSYRALKL